jgi:pimeloyl-ACP methyl ester carboxylesterase
MCDPTTDQAMNTVQKMEDTFQKAMKMWETGLESYNFDFNEKSLPAYITTPLEDEKPLFIVIGGGDTFREDLYFFGGSEALKRSYNVLLVDLPGQGKTPYDGMLFGRDTVNALSTILDKIDDMGFKGKKILSGYSGGGYFTTMLVSTGKKLDAWIASTPVFDFKLTIEKAIPALIGKANNLNPMLELALKKYGWQFGPGGLTNILQIFADIGVADYSKINVPSLFLAGLSEDEEMIRQARIIYDVLKIKQPASKIIEFDAATGADAHCQVNNLIWAQHQIFNWLKNSCL